jgi:hypothetical protein
MLVRPRCLSVPAFPLHFSAITAMSDQHDNQPEPQQLNRLQVAHLQRQIFHGILKIVVKSTS